MPMQIAHKFAQKNASGMMLYPSAYKTDGEKVSRPIIIDHDAFHSFDMSISNKKPPLRRSSRCISVVWI